MPENENSGAHKILRTLKRVATNNLWLKLISLMLAFAVWFGITGGPQSETTIDVNLDLNNYIPEDWALADEYINQVSVTLRGRDNVIQRIATSEQTRNEITISPKADAIEAVSEPQWIPLSPSDVFVRNAEAIRVQPPRILVKLDREVSRNKDVTVSITGQLPEGLRFFKESPNLNPNTVRVSGAKSLIESIDTVTARINLENVSINGVNLYPIRVLLERDSLLQYEPQEVVVTLDVVEVSDSANFTIRNVTFLGLVEETEVVQSYSPQQFGLEITGPASWVQSLEEEQIALQVPVMGLERNQTHRVELTADMVTFANSVPRNDLVTITFNGRSDAIAVVIRAR